jgi:hypothetical protein
MFIFGFGLWYVNQTPEIDRTNTTNPYIPPQRLSLPKSGEVLGKEMIGGGFRGFLELFFYIYKYCAARSYVSRLSRVLLNKKIRL